jgi:hypothetical protein
LPYKEQTSTLIDDAALLQAAQGAAVGNAIKRNGQVEFISAHAQVGTSKGNALRIAGKLKLGCSGAQRREVDITVRRE